MSGVTPAPDGGKRTDRGHSGTNGGQKRVPNLSHENLPCELLEIALRWESLAPDKQAGILAAIRRALGAEEGSG